MGAQSAAPCLMPRQAYSRGDRLGRAVLRVVVAVDERSDLKLVEAGCALALRESARLELVVGIARPSLFCAFAPGAAVFAQGQLQESDGLLGAALKIVDPSVSVLHRQVEGRAGRHVVDIFGDAVGHVVVLRTGRRASGLARRCRTASVVLVAPRTAQITSA